jgi:hypothetical protein
MGERNPVFIPRPGRASALEGSGFYRLPFDCWNLWLSNRVEAARGAGRSELPGACHPQGGESNRTLRA